jgi:hypothetical protein
MVNDRLHPPLPAAHGPNQTQIISILIATLARDNDRHFD